MNVVHISTCDLGGGAALAAYRLHRAMQARPGCSSSMLVRYKESRDPAVSTVHLSSGFGGRIQRKFERWCIRRDRSRYSQPLSKVEVFSEDRGCWGDTIKANLQSCDLIQLHWVSEFLNYRAFFREVPEEIPLVWRLADMNPFTGGCHYDGGCGRFTEACGRCPKLESDREHDFSQSIWRRKKSALDPLGSDRLHLVVLNRWMAQQAKRSSLLGRFQCSVIPNGVDLQEFRPIPPSVAREALGIPAGQRVLVFVADSVGNIRKGLRPLLEALRHLATRGNLLLLIVGGTRDLPEVNLPSLQVGHIESAACLRQIYSAAHVFVIPSLEDNQPNTVLEAMACGTPVVGFKVGGIPEMIEDSQTGLLAPRGDVQELAGAIAFLLDHEPERLAMSAQARRRVETIFSRDTQVDRYLELYSRLLAQHRVDESRVPTQRHPATALTSVCQT
jgi:glycosyltransferase involved in cell wall biosynthesis